MSASENKRFLLLSAAALGIVFGDIGTSPLYALRESLFGLPITPLNIFGVLSLIFWVLILVISVKYFAFILRADNDGEGGILSLLALLKRAGGYHYKAFFFVGILGAGLLIGDGMLTPAISVLSAIEGLAIISPAFAKFILPLTIVILIALFFTQHHGSNKIGRYFGPVLFVWFLTLGVLGISQIIQNPTVLRAINPYYAFEFFHHNGWAGYILLGGVFLVVTGGEALYADLGHFGKRPIRLAWFTVALPGLLLNYFGQGAHLLKFPDAIINPFYSIAPSWFSFPLLILATLATIIASQAVISATFSLTKQAVLLDLYPRLPIIQTSEQEPGQIYVPQMNVLLAIGALLLVLTFKSSSALTHAYGIAVNIEMLGVTVMVALLAYTYWKWSLLKVLGIFSVFLFIDLSFLGANSLKIATGGWVSLLFAAVSSTLMITWLQGVRYLRTFYYQEKIDLTDIIDQLDHSTLSYVKNSTIIFVTDFYDKSGGGLLHYFKLNKMMPEHVLIVSVAIKNHPYIPDDQRYHLTVLSKDIHRLILNYGYMDVIDLPKALTIANQLNLFSFTVEVEQATFLIEIPNVIATRRQKTLPFFWQEKLFVFLLRNSALDVEFFQLPYNRTIAIGAYCEI